jgi:stage II sporulation protein M
MLGILLSGGQTMNFKLAIQELKALKHYHIASALVFITGILMGAVNSEQFQVFIDTQLNAIKQLVQSIEGQENPEWSMFWLIFWNNTSKSLLIILLGFFFGVIPLFFLVANGLILGYLGAVSYKQNVLADFFVGIAPHGIIELPAIVLASSLGLRLGILVLKNVVAIASPTRSLQQRQLLRQFWKMLIPVAIMLVIALFFAAVIESTITYWIVKA